LSPSSQYFISLSFKKKSQIVNYLMSLAKKRRRSRRGGRRKRRRRKKR
jgi:hypothetical protein